MKINLHCLSFLSFIQKIHKIPTYHWSKTIESGGKSHYEINAFSSSCWPQLLQRSFPSYNSSEFSPIIPDEVREHLTRDQRPFLHPESLQILQIHSFFSSGHLTHLLQGSGQRTGMTSRSLVLCSVTHLCVVFEVCVWIIVRLEDPNVAHYKISNRVSHLLIFYLLVFDRIHDAMCLNKGPHL